MRMLALFIEKNSRVLSSQDSSGSASCLVEKVLFEMRLQNIHGISWKLRDPEQLTL